ncbi:MAG: hypothetical protein FJ095_01145 [Deltaproteobacteria bacterium]|nr:hypothetical protein [Deltaproteobacteria bacterium]
MRLDIERLAAAMTACLAAACATDASSGLAGTAPTEVTLEPEVFLDGVTCGPSGLSSYVVTLLAYDDATDTTPFLLPASRPLPCATTFAMRDLVIAGKRYGALIDGYEEDASALTPFGGSSSGSRTMLRADGTTAAPRWSSQCGAGANDAMLAVYGASNEVLDCAPLVDAQPTAPSLTLDPIELVGDNACSLAAELDLRRLSGSLDLPPVLACDAPPLTLAATSGELVRLYVRVARPDGPSAGRECEALPTSGKTVAPSCTPLSYVGRVTLAPHLVGAAACPAGAFFEVAVDGAPLPGSRIACGVTAQLGPLAPGLVDLAVALFDADGKQLSGGPSCKAEVEPGRTVAAACL